MTQSLRARLPSARTIRYEGDRVAGNEGLHGALLLHAGEPAHDPEGTATAKTDPEIFHDGVHGLTARKGVRERGGENEFYSVPFRFHRGSRISGHLPRLRR